MTFPPDKIGDNRQRYEVQNRRRDSGEWEVAGWTEHEDGGSLAEGARRMPAVSGFRVIDRHADGATVLSEYKELDE